MISSVKRIAKIFLPIGTRRLNLTIRIINKLRRARDIIVIRLSSLYSEKWYKNNYPDLNEAGVRNYLKHYYYHGCYEGRNPSSKFNTVDYFNTHPEIVGRNINPLVHYLVKERSFVRRIYVKFFVNNRRSGDLRLLRKTPLFDEEWYKSRYGDLVDAGVIDFLQHYYDSGAFEGRDPSPGFKTLEYFEEFPELAEKKINPLIHYLRNKKNVSRIRKNTSKISNDNLLVDEKLKIAVIVHCYYTDLLFGLLNSTKNISIPYDILLSVVSDEGVNKALEWKDKNGFNNLIIEKVPNRGRDIAPAVINWRDKIMEYDYACKIHTKKSLYTGREKNDWRSHLVFNLLGTKGIVNYILNSFHEDKKIGIICPDSWGYLPYWGYTWLSNKEQAKLVMDKLELDEKLDGYLDYPAGSMFWFRPNALKELFDGRIKLDDFAAEAGQTDGTFAHALERIFHSLAKKNGYSFLEINAFTNTVNKDNSHRNLRSYSGISSNFLKRELESHKIISFDIFDTLITRPYINPDDLFSVINQDIINEFNINIDFLKRRKEAEDLARKQLKRDVSYTDIYDSMKNNNILPIDVVSYAESREFSLELALLIPRDAMVEMFNYALSIGKKVILVSDMYLERHQIEKILSKNGIRGYEELYISNELDKRKDTGTMWQYLIDEVGIANEKFIHIGDNEHSDIQIPINFRLHTFHIMSSKSLFQNSLFGKKCIEKYSNDFSKLSFLGPVIAKTFNNPFIEAS